ncbi:MAG: hypothetical protein ABI045_00925 [Flavobacteriales bacterium]
MKVGFDKIDCVSFVSSKLIPQLRDTGELLKGFDLRDTTSKLLVIIGNFRRSQQVMDFKQVDFLGFSFLIFEIFNIEI